MKKYLILAFVPFFLLADEAADYNYKLGYQDGIKDGWYRAYSDGAADMLKAILRWKKTIDAMETGKFLFNSGNITPPMVFKELEPDGSSKITVKGCEVANPKGLADILASYRDIPILDATLKTMIDDKSSSRVSAKIQNSSEEGIRIIDKDMPATPKIQSIQNKYAERTYLYIRKTEMPREVLDSKNYVFSEGSDNYKVEFQNASERESFCAIFSDIRGCKGE